MGKWGKSFPDGDWPVCWGCSWGATGDASPSDEEVFAQRALCEPVHFGALWCGRRRRDRARANPAKGAKGKTLAFEEGTGLCTPCVTKRDTGRTSQKCYCGSARSYKQRKPAQEKRAKPKQGPSPPMPSVASTHARPTPSALDRMHRCEPALGRSFPAECASDEEEKEEQLPSIRKVSGGAKAGFFHDFGDGDEEGELGVEGAGGRRSDSDGEQQHVLSSDESDGESGAVDALETSAGTCLSTDLSPPAPPLSSPRVAPATGTPNSALGDDQPAGASLPPTSVRRGRLRWPTPCAMLLFVECRISCPLALRHPRLITSRCPSNRVLLGTPVRVRRRRLRPALAVSSRRRRTRGWARVWTWST